MSGVNGLDADRVLASYLFGLWSSTFLFGVITVQTFLYYKKYPKDTFYSRGLVGLLWMMQGAEAGITSYGVYTTLMSNAGLLQLLIQPWHLSYYGTHGVLVAVMVQAFFISRYWSVSRNIFITILLTALATCALGLGFYVTIVSYLSPQSSFQTLAAVHGVLTAWLSFAAFVDIMIAAALAFEMKKRRTGFQKYDASIATNMGLF
ncbi:hypothetical protein DL93DRAFT_2225869 [Clavulina sp. PMI_390]|nr:hypothetical protein DL93DRAFT_2225869 [Clavulina sp. PMI_390]